MYMLCWQFDVNGVVTLDENIADLTGLKGAYFAYQRFLDIHGQEPRLPGLEQYNQEQMFFLGYANVSIIRVNTHTMRRENIIVSLFDLNSHLGEQR